MKSGDELIHEKDVTTVVSLFKTTLLPCPSALV